MHDTLRFWLDRGVDGFRMDVIHGIVKARTSSTCPTTGSRALVALNDHAGTHAPAARHPRRCSTRTPVTA